MNAALRTVERAITKLEAKRDAAFPGPWEAYHSGVARGDHSHVVAEGSSIAYISANDGIDEEYRKPTADLIVILHATIESQLIILRMFAERIQQSPGYEPPIRSEHMALAHAILGGDL